MTMTKEFTIDRFVQRQCEKLKPRFPVEGAITGTTDWPGWRAGLRSALIDAMGGFPEELPELDIRVISTEKRPGHTRTLLTFVCEEDLVVPAYYLVPDNITKPAPAVVAIAGHGYGTADIAGIDIEGRDYEEDADFGGHKRFALELCRRGFVVIAPEMFCFGPLRLSKDIDTHPQAKSCERVAMRLLLAGRNIAWIRAFACMRSMEVLRALGDVDMGRVGCMGISAGGWTSTLFGALDERVAACVVSGFPSTFRAALLEQDNNCIDGYVYGVLRYGELYDILSLVAPRPMLWEVGEKDVYFPIKSALESAEIVGKAYGALGVPERFEIDHFDGPHEISGRKSYDFLKKWL